MQLTAGQRFGRWVVLADRERGALKVPCRCDCGTEQPVNVYNIRNGATQSCGCLRTESIVQRSTTHGTGYEDYRYRLWRKIKSKCLAEAHAEYPYYGGRGITMHPPWIDDFTAFAAYIDTALGERPEGGTFDRIDNDGNYEPGNVRWADREAQALNRRNRWRDRAAEPPPARTPLKVSFKSGGDQRGAECHSAKLTEADVRTIIAALGSGRSQVAVAREFGISQPQVSRIARRVTWRHLWPDGAA